MVPAFIQVTAIVIPLHCVVSRPFQFSVYAVGSPAPVPNNAQIIFSFVGAPFVQNAQVIKLSLFHRDAQFNTECTVKFRVVLRAQVFPTISKAATLR